MVSGVAAGAEGPGRPEGILGPGHGGAHGVDQVGTVSIFMLLWLSVVPESSTLLTFWSFL